MHMAARTAARTVERTAEREVEGLSRLLTAH